MGRDQDVEVPDEEVHEKGADLGNTVRTFLADALSGLAMSYLVVVGALVAAVVVPMVFGWQPHVAVSGSMRPTFDPGEVVLVAPAEAGRFYKAPSVITYRQDGALVTHRVVDIEVTEKGTSYATKGDANRVEDSSRVEHEDVVGAVRMVVPLVGMPMLWLQQRHWVPLALFVGSIVGALSVVRREPSPLPELMPGVQAVQAGT